MIPAIVDALVVCLCCGLAILGTAVRDDFNEIRDRLDQLERRARERRDESIRPEAAA